LGRLIQARPWSAVVIFTLALAPVLCLAQKQTHIYLDRGSEQMLASPDVAFVIKAAQSTTAEIQLGQLAIEKAENPSVREFAQRVVRDRTKAGEQLKQIAKQQHMTLPANMTAGNQAQYDKLQLLSGRRFDQTYMNDMVNDHRADSKSFFKEGKNGKEPAIRNFAAELLPTIEEQLAAAKSIHAELISGGS
jgi:putative membrane protein